MYSYCSPRSYHETLVHRSFCPPTPVSFFWGVVMKLTVRFMQVGCVSEHRKLVLEDPESQTLLCSSFLDNIL